MTTSRRRFLLDSAALIAAGASMPAFLSRAASACAPGGDAPILVIVQLTGGNDGLNTVIPYEQDAYHRARPTLAIDKNDVLRLNDAVGLHPEMTGFRELFDEGMLSVINGVGYPNPDRSHFRSMDIWHTASATPEASRDGWLGRTVETLHRPGAAPAALHLSGEALPLALVSRQRAVPSIESIDAFQFHGDEDLKSAIAAARPAGDDQLQYVQRVAISACDSAQRIARVARGETASATYPNYGLADRLSQVAQLIGAGFGSRIYYTSLGGFDTHSRQAFAHGPLLRELSSSVTAFMRDLKARGLADRVTLMTFSEFGRRVRENGSQGTDHGAGAPMFVTGAAVRGGLHGVTPDLGALDDGDVQHAIDFRSVYGSMLDWLGVDAQAILGARYDAVQGLRA